MEPVDDTVAGRRDRYARRAATELGESAEILRGLIPRFRDTPISEFAPLAMARLLDSIAASLQRGVVIDESIVSSALEIARHTRTYSSNTPERLPGHP